MGNNYIENAGRSYLNNWHITSVAERTRKNTHDKAFKGGKNAANLRLRQRNVAGENKMSNNVDNNKDVSCINLQHPVIQLILI